MGTQTSQNNIKNKNSINIKSFLISIIVIFIFMLASYIATFFIDKGIYDSSGYHFISKATPLPFYKFILSPFLVLRSENNITIIGIVILIIILGGVLSCLNELSIISCTLNMIISKFGKRKYLLMFVLIAFFMILGSLASIFEECVILVPLIIVLSKKLGWDDFTGLSISLISVGCGFACGIINPFTIGVAQSLTGLPIFSGIWIRILTLIICYVVISLFTYFRAKKIDTHPKIEEIESVDPPYLKKASIAFMSILMFGFILIVIFSTIPNLRDFTTIAILISFLLSCIVSASICKAKTKSFLLSFGKGIISALPAVLMILMASSIKFILDDSQISGTLINAILPTTNTLPPFIVLILLFAFAYILNFFIPSGSAEAFIVIPIISQIALSSGLTNQMACLSFIYGDGFSNLVFPTIPVLLICLSFTKLNYFSYMKKSWYIHLTLLIVSITMLALAFATKIS